MSSLLVYFVKRKPSADDSEELKDIVAGVLNQHWWAVDIASCLNNKPPIFREKNCTPLTD